MSEGHKKDLLGLAIPAVIVVIVLVILVIISLNQEAEGAEIALLVDGESIIIKFPIPTNKKDIVFSFDMNGEEYLLSIPNIKSNEERIFFFRIVLGKDGLDKKLLVSSGKIYNCDNKKESYYADWNRFGQGIGIKEMNKMREGSRNSC